MTSIDDRIKDALKEDSAAIDELLAKEGGLPDMIAGSFKGGMRRWMTLMYVIIMVVTGFMVWSIYNFFTVGAVDQVFWGFCSLGLIAMQIAMKQWTWMEMNRTSTSKEIMRLELVIARLSSKLDGKD